MARKQINLKHAGASNNPILMSQDKVEPEDCPACTTSGYCGVHGNGVIPYEKRKPKSELERIVGEPLDHNPDPVADLKAVVVALIAACEKLHTAVTTVSPRNHEYALAQLQAKEYIAAAKQMIGELL